MVMKLEKRTCKVFEIFFLSVYLFLKFVILLSLQSEVLVELRGLLLLSLSIFFSVTAKINQLNELSSRLNLSDGNTNIDVLCREILTSLKYFETQLLG